MPGPTSPLLWEQRGPRSALYGDIYFSLEDGLAESRAVFLHGCGLPQAWAGRNRFVVAELGFGSGLNICALLRLWREHRPPQGRLNIFTIEGHPIQREEAARALSAFPEIANEAGQLLAQWPGRRRGMHRIDLRGDGVVVDLAVMEATAALEGWSGLADAWFLDGFSPALNPAMWSEDVLGLVAAKSAPGARVATFTVAGDVRRRLQAGGFEIEKKPGFGRKRERLEARLPGAREEGDVGDVLIIGGGIAGAALKHAFDAVGVTAPVVADPDAVAASGNPAALVTPALDAGGGARTAFYADAFARAVALYDAIPQAVIARGCFQLETERRDVGRFDKIAQQDVFEPGTLQRLDAGTVATALHEPASEGALRILDGLTVDPEVIRRHWLGEIVAGRAVAIRAAGDGHAVELADGQILRARTVVLACGIEAAQLAGMPLSPVRGQASIADGLSTQACAFGAYAVPTRTGVLFGATHDRGQDTAEIRSEDHDRNLAALAGRRPGLAAQLEGAKLRGRAAIRATTADRMPLAGRIGSGVFILSGLGSRGFCTAPLLAEHVAALVARAPSPLRRELAALVDPLR